MVAKRSCELGEKFWEVWCEGSNVFTRHGKLGTKGHVKIKKTASESDAKRVAAKLADQKTKEGYSEKRAAPRRVSRSASRADGFAFPSEVPKTAVPAAGAPLARQLEAFERAVDIGPLAWNERIAKGKSKAEIQRIGKLLDTRPLFDQINARLSAIRDLATRLAKRGDDRKIAAALRRVVREHPCDSVRDAVGEAVVEAGAPKSALAEIATWMDARSRFHDWMPTTGARALLHHDPAAAYDVLAPRLADPKRIRDVFVALQSHAGDVDPRFFEAAMRWMPEGPGKPSAQHFFEAHGKKPEAQAILVRATEKLAAGKSEPKRGYFYMMLRAIKVPMSVEPRHSRIGSREVLS